MDSLLPQVAADLHTTVGVAAMVVTAYAVTHGSIQLIIGPISDRFGKYRTVALTCAIGAVPRDLRDGVNAAATRAGAACDRCGRRLGHTDIDGLCR